MALTTVQNLMIGGGVPITSNTQVVTSSYTIPTGSSGMSAGPVTINAGVTITVSAGSRWVVV
jgi:hypothetical protein